MQCYKSAWALSRGTHENPVAILFYQELHRNGGAQSIFKNAADPERRSAPTIRTLRSHTNGTEETDGTRISPSPGAHGNIPKAVVGSMYYS